jgi:hypothetical protein
MGEWSSGGVTKSLMEVRERQTSIINESVWSSGREGRSVHVGEE